ncbi:hypothetical protein, partial [Streptococcus pneumoniae]|uniref:hypothetical protein n=1 Tax=Streptococcus pneumoniae TaxID=1313 RepID=UPI0018B04360
VNDFQGLQANIRELADIEALLDSKDPKVQRSVGSALGLKNMLPEWASTALIGDDETALALRGKLSNVTSGVFLERSGASVTPSEAKRLEG